jgi:RNA polymerase sigma-70 factor, ECF subfamily
MYSVLMRFATINGLPVSSWTDPRDRCRLRRSKIDGDVIHALYVVRNPDKLRHLAAGSPREAYQP